MNPEQRSMGPLSAQSDPDSSQPDAEPGQRSLNQGLRRHVAVKTIGDRIGRRQPSKADCRFARPVQSERGGIANSLRSYDDHDWRLAP